MVLVGDSVLKLSFLFRYFDNLGQKLIYSDKKKVLLLVLVIDFILGFCAQHVCTLYGFLPQHVPDLIVYSTEYTVTHLKQVLHWLMSNPAGLKLNSVLSQALGNFFLYHIHLWVTYVDIVLPAVGDTFILLSPILHYFPLTFQLSILGDVLSILCIHIFCFYAYARRITTIQYSGCLAYARLFAGKKYNPLRNRIDTVEDVLVEHLFVGTILFTILLFLLPTTLTFFSVFYVLRLISLGILKVISISIFWINFDVFMRIET